MMDKNNKTITVLAILTLGFLLSCSHKTAPESNDEPTPSANVAETVVKVNTISEPEAIVIVEPAVVPEPAKQAPAPKPIAEPESTAPVAKTISSGSFSKVAVATSGTVKFIQTGDTATIELSNFSTSSAPDLGIYLSKKSSISSSADISSAIKLAQLRSSSGNQTYSVPAHIDLSQYNSIAIHCTAYNKLFGSASVK